MLQFMHATQAEAVETAGKPKKVPKGDLMAILLLWYCL